jgi:hypothetical protein
VTSEVIPPTLPSKGREDARSISKFKSQISYLSLGSRINWKDVQRLCQIRHARVWEYFDGYTTMWYYYIVVFIESAAFTRRLGALAGNKEGLILRGIQNELMELPSRGDLVPGLGGIRKARFGNPGRRKGKRGGYRYFYLYLEHRQNIHLLLLLDKDEQEDLSNEERTIIRGMVTELKKAGGTK